MCLRNPLPSLNAGGPEESPLPRDGVSGLVSSKKRPQQCVEVFFKHDILFKSVH